MKIPFDIGSFLAVNENKIDLFQLIQRGVREQKLDDDTVYSVERGQLQK